MFFPSHKLIVPIEFFSNEKLTHEICNEVRLLFHKESGLLLIALVGKIIKRTYPLKGGCMLLR